MATLTHAPDEWQRRVLVPTTAGQLEIRDARAGLTPAQQWLLRQFQPEVSLAEIAMQPGAPDLASLVRDASVLLAMGFAQEARGARRSVLPPLTQAPPDLDDSRLDTTVSDPDEPARRPAWMQTAALAGVGFVGTLGLIYAFMPRPGSGPAPAPAVPPTTAPAPPPAVAAPAPPAAPSNPPPSPTPATTTAPAAESTASTAAATGAKMAPSRAAPAATPPTAPPATRPTPSRAPSPTTAPPPPAVEPRRPPPSVTTTPAPPPPRRDAEPAPAAPSRRDSVERRPPPSVPAPFPTTAPAPTRVAPSPPPPSPAPPPITRTPSPYEYRPLPPPPAPPPPAVEAVPRTTPAPLPAPASAPGAAGSSAAPAAPPLAPLSQVRPQFPREALSGSRREVTLRARLAINGQGEVTRVDFIDSMLANRPFERAARDALQQWRFPPGAPDRSYRTEVHFKLE